MSSQDSTSDNQATCKSESILLDRARSARSIVLMKKKRAHGKILASLGDSLAIFEEALRDAKQVHALLNVRFAKAHKAEVSQIHTMTAVDEGETDLDDNTDEVLHEIGQAVSYLREASNSVFVVQESAINMLPPSSD